MKIKNLLSLCLLGCLWAGLAAHEPAAVQAPGLVPDQVIEQKKPNASNNINIEQLIEKYKKYEQLMIKLGLLKPNQTSRIGRFLKYAAEPAGFGGFWLMINLLVHDEYSGLIKLDIPVEHKWFVSWLTGALACIACNYAGDYFLQPAELAHSRAVLGAFVQDWEAVSSQVPEELHPMFALLYNFYRVDGVIDLDDELLVALLKEIKHKHKKSFRDVRSRITALEIVIK